MKKVILSLVMLIGIGITSVKSQEEASSPFTVGADIYSNYVWRGSKFGTGPAFQPSVKFNKGIFTAGVWGSFDASGYTEADPYVSIALSNGLSLGLTDYYYPTAKVDGEWVGTKYFEFDPDSSFHALELNLGYTIKSLSLSANYIFNESAGALSSGGDMYFQATYAFSNASVFVGAGDGWHTSDTEFAVCNIGVSTSKTIKLSDTFSIPVNGSVILNPEKEQLFVVVGLSF
jgi:hypothetical protein